MYLPWSDHENMDPIGQILRKKFQESVVFDCVGYSQI